MYIYKEYNDAQAYGEEILKLYDDEDDAKSHLIKQVEKHFNLPFYQVARLYDNSDNIVRPDYVSVIEGNGCSFWIVTETEKKPSGTDDVKAFEKALADMTKMYKAAIRTYFSDNTTEGRMVKYEAMQTCKKVLQQVFQVPEDKTKEIYDTEYRARYSSK